MEIRLDFRTGKGAMWAAGKEAIREAQNRGRGYRDVAGLARSGPGTARASFDVHLSPGLDPGLRPGAWHAGSTFCGAQPSFGTGRDDGFSQSVIVGVASATDGRLNARLGEPLGVTERDVLHAAIAVMHQWFFWV